MMSVILPFLAERVSSGEAMALFTTGERFREKQKRTPTFLLRRLFRKKRDFGKRHFRQGRSTPERIIMLTIHNPRPQRTHTAFRITGILTLSCRMAAWIQQMRRSFRPLKQKRMLRPTQSDRYSRQRGRTHLPGIQDALFQSRFMRTLPIKRKLRRKKSRSVEFAKCFKARGKRRSRSSLKPCRTWHRPGKDANRPSGIQRTAQRQSGSGGIGKK